MKTRPVIFPFLIALAPLLSLYAKNHLELAASELVLPSLVVLSTVALVWLVLWAIFKDPYRAGYWVTVATIAFYTVDRAPFLIKRSIVYITGFWIQYNIFSDLAWTCIPCLAVYLVAGYFLEKRIKDRRKMTSVLNVFSLVLIFLPLVNLAHSKPKVVETKVVEPSPPALAKLSPQSADCPDIYYIILDAFARGDVLREKFDFDLEPFLQSLEKRGFYVARNSTSNYSTTRVSLSSSLNGIYHEKHHGNVPGSDEVNSSYFANNAVIKTLRPLGYRFVSFSSGYGPTDQTDVDVYMASSPFVSEFHRLLVSNSVLRFLIYGNEKRDEYTSFRQRTQFTIDQLPRVAKMPGHKFIFAHMVSPHPPFVFGEHGEDVSPHEIPYRSSDGNIYLEYYGDAESYVKGYRAQVVYLVSRIDKMIDQILANSSKPPIIILQSDHGSGLGLNLSSAEATDHHERMSILNAYYIPGKRYDGLYQTITPANSFRAVLNIAFGLNLPLLPDENYYSTMKNPFDFVNVTEKVRSHATKSHGEVETIPVHASPAQKEKRDAPTQGRAAF